MKSKDVAFMYDADVFCDVSTMEGEGSPIVALFMDKVGTKRLDSSNRRIHYGKRPFVALMAMDSDCGAPVRIMKWIKVIHRPGRNSIYDTYSLV